MTRDLSDNPPLRRAFEIAASWANQEGRPMAVLNLNRMSGLYVTRAWDDSMVLLSVNAGLRAIEISKLVWGMVLDAEGNVSDVLELRDNATKGEKGGRLVPLCAELRAALQALKGDDTPAADARIIHSERDLGLSAGAITVWFHRLYNRLGLKGASSHSGRRTFVTELAKTIVAHGRSLRDVQQLAGHASLATTQRYIEGNSDAKRSAIEALGKLRVRG